MTSPPVLTAEGLLEIHEVGYRHELVRGELTSPCDSWGEVQEKALSWLEHGARLVWIVDCKAKRVTVYRGPRDVVVLGPADTLDGGEVAPGFAVAVAALFPGPVR